MTNLSAAAPGTGRVITMAEHAGGMLALVPDNPGALAVDGGEPPDELHLTLLYLGDDVTSWPPEQANRLTELMLASAPAFEPVTARIMGRAVFNPDGGPDGDRDPCCVYLVGDTGDLDPLRHWAQWVTTTGDDYATPPEQHKPWLPHITAKYGGNPNDLTYTGPVRFGTLRLALAGNVLDLPLGEEEPSVSGPQIKSITFTPSAEVREAAMATGLDGEIATAVIEGKALAAEGLVWVAAHCGEIGQQWAGEMLSRIEVKRGAHSALLSGPGAPRKLDAPTQPDDDDDRITNLTDLDDAIDAHGGCPPEQRPDRVRKLRGAAHRLKAPEHTRARIDSLEGATTELKDAADGIEVKVASPDPRAAKLREYWAHGKGRKKWRPGTPGDFKRLRRHLAKYVHTPRVLNGLTANIHKLATGEWPGPKAHTPGGNRGKPLLTKDDWSDEIETKETLAAEAALHDGVDDWGGVEDGFDPDDYITSLDLGDLDAPDDGDTSDLRATTDRYKAMKLVADDGLPNIFDTPAGAREHH
jgi:2'-5' RNA ligase